VTRLNDESDWITQQIPELRIVPQALWDKAKTRQKELDARTPGLWRRKRPRYLLSGLVQCGECGGGFSKINHTHYGCSGSRNKGESVCTNRKTMAREKLEGAVLSALQTHLMRDDLVEVFCQEYTNHLNALRVEQDRARKSRVAEKRRLEKELENLITSIKNGIDTRLVKSPLEHVSARLEELETLIAPTDDSEPPKPLVHPAMAQRYRLEVKNLRKALESKDARAEAADHLRALIGKIVLTPEPGRDDLRIDLHGDLAGILSIASQKRVRPGKAPNGDASGPNKITLVAGASFVSRFAPIELRKAGIK
jgi:hypothetical protein